MSLHTGGVRYTRPFGHGSGWRDPGAIRERPDMAPGTQPLNSRTNRARSVAERTGRHLRELTSPPCGPALTNVRRGRLAAARPGRLRGADAGARGHGPPQRRGPLLHARRRRAARRDGGDDAAHAGLVGAEGRGPHAAVRPGAGGEVPAGRADPGGHLGGRHRPDPGDRRRQEPRVDARRRARRGRDAARRPPPAAAPWRGRPTSSRPTLWRPSSPRSSPSPPHAFPGLPSPRR